MSIEDYRQARQLGQKDYRSRLGRGQEPHLQVLDRVLSVVRVRGEESLGLVNIPVSHIVGTKTAGRAEAFAANFMPLLEEGSEFAAKWSGLADAHLDEGIREPVTAYEYLNRFYIQEGNKRTSVLKFFGAVSIPATVTRILPQDRDSLEGRIYADFLDFYRLTGVNHIWFSQPGRFRSLLHALGKGERPWTEEEREGFYRRYAAFRSAFKALGGDRLPGTTGDAFLAYHHRRLP